MLVAKGPVEQILIVPEPRSTSVSVNNSTKLRGEHGVDVQSESVLVIGNGTEIEVERGRSIIIEVVVNRYLK